MALTPFRWVALAAIGCMLAIVALVSAVDTTAEPPRARLGTAVDTVEARLRARAGALNQEAQALAARYRVLALMDSTSRATSRVPDTGAMRVFIADGYPSDIRALIEQRIRLARTVRRGDAVPVDVYVVSDTPRYIRGVTRYLPSTEVRYQLPERPGQRCVVYIRTFAMGDIPTAFGAEKSPEQILGPCGFYAAFGEPGPAVRQWMMTAGWRFATEGSWTTAPARRGFLEDRSIFTGPSAATRYVGVGAATECMKGELDSCERILATRPTRRRSAPAIGSGTYAIPLGRTRYFPGAIGTQAGELLASAVRELGRERFRAFWSSADSVPVAYQQASGEPWGALIQRWMIANYGELHPGPRLSPSAAITSAILVLLALGATMLISVRRTYV